MARRWGSPRGFTIRWNAAYDAAVAFRSVLFAAAAVFIVHALVGCGGGTSGDGVSGTGYSVGLPEGWQEQTEEAGSGAINFDLFLAGEREGGFVTTVNVIREDPPGVPGDVDELVETYERQLEAFGETSPQPLPSREIDGEPARGNTVEVQAPEVRYTVVQYFTIHDDAVYTVTLGAHKTALSDARPLFDELLESWRWD
jgi:hypothetical protein